MPCENPHLVYKFGKRFFFSAPEAVKAGFVPGEPGTELIKVRCGKCPDCRLNYSRMWASRCMAEASLCEDNIFLTLTYDDQHLPGDNSLRMEDLQMFWKRLRNRGLKFRYFACGEYGSQTHRPHYHAIIFGYRPDDLGVEYVSSENGLSRVQDSPFLREVWSNGNVSVGEVSSASCAYVARYCTKKLSEETRGDRRSEFVVMSRRPAVGSEFYRKYLPDIVVHDSVFAGGRWCKPPRVFEAMLDKQTLDAIKANRVKQAVDYAQSERRRKNDYLRAVFSKKRSF